ncbi:hypothetical protein V6N13_014134 [Hibiscus sabdariffa]|uniref:Uncharacterized protein n=1 Tax=Hibiscus sabdariffa TaxID=183260 RepID=A0ABR2RV04_9ROSI
MEKDSGLPLEDMADVFIANKRNKEGKISRLKIGFTLNFGSLSERKAEMLEAPFSLKEFEEAVWSCDNLRPQVLLNIKLSGATRKTKLDVEEF